MIVNLTKNKLPLDSQEERDYIHQQEESVAEFTIKNLDNKFNFLFVMLGQIPFFCPIT